MMQAMAAEAAEAGGGHGAFYDDPTFWVAVAFVLMFLLIGKKLYHALCSLLDERAEKIRLQIEEATRLREEAQELLATYERKQHEAKAEAEAIVERARKEAERLQVKAHADLEDSLTRRESQAMERITQAEAKAKEEVQAKAVDIAVAAVAKILEQQVSGEKADKLVDAAIKDLQDKLH